MATIRSKSARYRSCDCRRHEAKRTSRARPRPRSGGPTIARSDDANEGPLAKLDATGAQNGVSGGRVKVEVGQGELQEIGLTFEAHLLSTDHKGDVAVLRTVDILRPEALHEAHGLDDALLERGDARLLVGEFWDLHSGEPRRCALGEIGGNLNLADQRKHVRGKPPIEQDLGIDVAFAKASALSRKLCRLASICRNAGTEG